MANIDPAGGGELIRAVLEFASRPPSAPAYLSLVQDGQVLIEGWLPSPGRQHRAERYPAGWASLTEAELRVVRLVVAGLTNREIAARLYLSWHTVNSHLRHVLCKLDLHSRVDLTRVALQHDPGLRAVLRHDPGLRAVPALRDRAELAGAR
jgi:DNA-binding CsgD family transcriptional regulator